MTFDDAITARILEPIAGDSGPVGPNGRRGEGSAKDRFDALKDQVLALRNAESKVRGVADPDGASDDDEPVFQKWSAAATEAVNYLAETSKDLEVGCFLVEAYLRDHGLEGLRDSLALVGRLIETFWDEGLHPTEDEDEEDDEERVTGRFVHLGNLSGQTVHDSGLVLVALRRLPLAGGLTYGLKAELDALAKRRSEAQGTDREAVALERYNRLHSGVLAQVAQAPLAEVRASISLTNECVEQWSRLCEIIAARSPFALSAGGLAQMLESIRSWLSGMFHDRLAEQEASGTAAGEGANAGDGDGKAGAVDRGGGRAGALAAIISAADYFERAEPLSPIGPALRDVHRRARLTFHELMLEVIPEDDRRESFYLHCGIKAPQNS